MTFLETIKPHLISDDTLVQETVLHAIHDFPNLPEEWIVDLLREAFTNEEKQSSILIYLSNQKINEEALKVLIEYIPSMDQSKRHLAIRLLDHVEPALAITYKDLLKNYIPKETWDIYHVIENGTEEDVYMAYGQLVNKLDDAASFQHNLYIRAKKLAKCIVEKDWITEKEIDITMSEELGEDWFSFNGIMHVYMIGLLKMKKYIPILASLLTRDEDILLEEVASTLIGFQSDEVVTEVSPYLRNPDSIIFATSVVENIKTEYAVQVLIDAYHNTEELEDQELIVEALCHQYSKKALPIISSQMASEYTTTLVDLEQAAYGTYTVLGEKHPDLLFWKQEALQREMEEILPATPIINETKVGRNEPCPCGSGKKYKKCCGK